MVNLRIYVHDLQKTIGHSRALIELLSRYPASEVESITIVSFTCDDFKEIFPQLSVKVHWVRVPFSNLSPVLLKIFFYHLYCLIDMFFHVKERTQTLSIGIANPLCSIIYLQFVHSQWRSRYFKTLPRNPLKRIYKMGLYFYLCAVEQIFYRRKNKQFISVAAFISKYVKEKFKQSEQNLHLIYSGHNDTDFSLNQFATREEAMNRVKDEAMLSESVIKHEKPIFLFVGAFERKGLDLAIRWLEPVKEKIDFIVIGKAEEHSHLKTLPGWIRHIEHTKNIANYYALADHFIFPSTYEPFGLVLTEAFAMGCSVITNYNEVGASEVLESYSGVYFLDKAQINSSDFLKITPWNQKSEISKERSHRLDEHNWTLKTEQFKLVIRRDSDNSLLSYLP